MSDSERAAGRSGVAVTCVLADDHPAVLGAISRLLVEHGVELLATASDGEAAIAAIRRHEPAVAVLDIRMPGLSGVEIARQTPPGTAVVLYTGYQDRELLHEGLEAGARGIVLKEAPLDDLIRAIQTVAAGDIYLDPVLAGLFVSQAGGMKALSGRERSVLRLLADGHQYDAIGRLLSIAPATVRSHLRNAMRKLETDTRTQAVADALRRSLID